jgi:hypothetical protein
MDHRLPSIRDRLVACSKPEADGGSVIISFTNGEIPFNITVFVIILSLPGQLTEE